MTDQEGRGGESITERIAVMLENRYCKDAEETAQEIMEMAEEHLTERIAEAMAFALKGREQKPAAPFPLVGRCERCARIAPTTPVVGATCECGCRTFIYSSGAPRTGEGEAGSHAADDDCVERVARAIYDAATAYIRAADSPTLRADWDANPDKEWTRNQARAAIAAVEGGRGGVGQVVLGQCPKCGPSATETVCSNVDTTIRCAKCGTAIPMKGDA